MILPRSQYHQQTEQPSIHEYHLTHVSPSQHNPATQRPSRTPTRSQPTNHEKLLELSTPLLKGQALVQPLSTNQKAARIGGYLFEIQQTPG